MAGAGMVGANLRFANLTQVCFNQVYVVAGICQNTNLALDHLARIIVIGASKAACETNVTQILSLEGSKV
jgi:hypothetical protein